ncbi:MAG: VOC family protein [Dehalococcoidales bacterium]|nr:VOC family protein [Dehalococcoidales bacterium]
MNDHKIDHIGIAVKDIDAAIKLYRDYIGLECEPIQTFEKSGLRLVFLKTGESSLELLCPMAKPPKGSDGEMIATFIKEKGEGIHHIALVVDDINGTLKKLDKNGIALDDKVGRPGAHGLIAFLNSKSTYGTVLELCEPKH